MSANNGLFKIPFNISLPSSCSICIILYIITEQNGGERTVFFVCFCQCRPFMGMNTATPVQNFVVLKKTLSSGS